MGLEVRWAERDLIVEAFDGLNGFEALSGSNNTSGQKDYIS